MINRDDDLGGGRRKPVPLLVLADLTPQNLTLEDEVILPEQLSSNGPPESGVRKLMQAMLETALRDLASPDRWDKDSAWAWIENPNEDYVFGFQNVCDVLGMSADALRRACREHGSGMRDRLTQNRREGNKGRKKHHANNNAEY